MALNKFVVLCFHNGPLPAILDYYNIFCLLFRIQFAGATTSGESFLI